MEERELKESLRAALGAVQRGSGGYEKAVRVVCSAAARVPAAHRAAALETTLCRAVETLLGAPPLDRCVDRCVGFVGALCGAVAAPPLASPSVAEALLARAAARCSAAGRAVRQRSAQLVAAVLDALPDDGTGALDEALYAALRRALLARVRDRLPAVRVHAVAALARLQDPSDSTDPAVRALEARLATDPSPCVRRAALADLVVTRATLPALLARTRDAAAPVRAAAFRAVAARVDARSLAPRQRAELVANGLGDRAPAVRRACADLVRDAWLPAAASAPALLALLAPEEHPAEALAAAACLEGAPSTAVPPAPSLVSAVALAKELVPTGLVSGDEDEQEQQEHQSDSPVNAALAVAWRAHCAALLERRCEEEERRAWFPPVARIVAIVGSGRATVAASTVLLGAVVELYGTGRHTADGEGADAAAAEMALSMDTDARLVEPLLQVVEVTNKTLLCGDISNGSGLIDSAVQLATVPEDGEGNEETVAKRLERAARVALFVLCHAEGGSISRETVIVAVAQRVALPAVRCADHAARAAGLRLLAAVCVALAEGAPPQPADAADPDTDADDLQLYAYLTVLVDALEHGTDEVPRTVAEGLFDVVMACPALQRCLDILNTSISTSNSASNSNRFMPLVARWLRFCEHALGDLDRADLAASAAEGFAKTLFHDLLAPVPGTRAERILAQLVVLLHHPRAARPPRLRQCLSVFFPAFVSGPRAPAHRALLEAALPRVLRACTRAEGTLEFAVAVARFVLGLIASSAAADAAAAAGAHGADAAATQAHMQVHVSIATVLGARALAAGQCHGPLCRVYSHALTQCTLDGAPQDARDGVRALAEMTAECIDDDALTRRALTRFVARLGAPGAEWAADPAPFRERAQQLADAVRALNDEDDDEVEDGDGVCGNALPLSPIKKAVEKDTVEEGDEEEEDTEMADDDAAAVEVDEVRKQHARRRLSHRSSQRPSIAPARNRLSLAQTAAVTEQCFDDGDSDSDEGEDKNTTKPYFDVSSFESDNEDAMQP